MAKNKQDNNVVRKETAYPYYPFRTSLKLAEAVKQCGGGRLDVSKDVLANELKMAESSPSFAQVLASAKCFGMIEGRGSYHLTEDAQRYFFPTSENEDIKAKLAFFMRPTAFRRVVERFDGNSLPDSKTLSNILLRDGDVPKSWVARVVSLFMDAANELGLIDDQGHLRYAVAMKKASRTDDQTRAETVHQHGQVHERAVKEEAGTRGVPANASSNLQDNWMGLGATIQAESRHPAEPKTNIWSFREAGGMVRVESPDPLPRVLWERLKRYVEVIEPAQEQEKTAGAQPVSE